MSDTNTQNIQFIQACPPAMDDGEYIISVEHSVMLPSGKQGEQDTKTISTSQEFSVKGPRFQMDAEDIDSVFPPANQDGSYGNCLPHIIVKRKTFAWERDLYANKTVRLEAGSKPLEVIPWVAVLCFSKDEAPEIVKNTVRAIVSPEPGIVTGEIILDTKIGESESTPCLTIDIPSEQFNAIVPNASELKYLAHGRKVETDNKDIGASKDGYYSIIIGNRFPLAGSPGVTNIAHLVSFEGLGERLPGGSSTVTDPKIKIRLISLANWEYTVMDQTLNFKKLLENLSPAKRLNVSVLDSEPQQDVKQALNMGYAPLNHKLRTGEKSVSWYRGPFVPLSVDEQKMDCYPCADALLRYNPDTGMFDVSYSAAWQIGRLLALQNKSFATTLYKWRRKNNQQSAFNMMRKTLNKKLANSLDFSDKKVGNLGDGMIGKNFMDFIRQKLGPTILKDAENIDNKVIQAGDFAGIENKRDDIPGILSSKELADIENEGDDTINKIINKVKEKD